MTRAAVAGPYRSATVNDRRRKHRDAGGCLRESRLSLGTQDRMEPMNGVWSGPPTFGQATYKARGRFEYWVRSLPRVVVTGSENDENKIPARVSVSSLPVTLKGRGV